MATTNGRDDVTSCSRRCTRTRKRVSSHASCNLDPSLSSTVSCRPKSSQRRSRRPRLIYRPSTYRSLSANSRTGTKRIRAEPRLCWTRSTPSTSICCRSSLRQRLQVSLDRHINTREGSHIVISGKAAWPLVQNDLKYFINNGKGKKMYMDEVNRVNHLSISPTD